MSLSRLVRPAETRVRAKRVATDSSTFVVESRTMGAPMSYNLTTANLSRTGLLLEQGSYKAPFRVNTLLELTIDPRASMLPQSVRCVGKVVRLAVANEGQRQGYGIQIVQMEGKDLEVWERAIASMEKVEGDREGGDKLLPAAS